MIEEEQSTGERIVDLYLDGISIQNIARKVNWSAAEVTDTIRAFEYAQSPDFDMHGEFWTS